MESNEILKNVSRPEFLYAAGAVLVLVVILILLLRRQPRNVVAYKTDDGSVLVSRSAITELVQTSCEQLDDVSKPSVQIKVKGGVSHFQVRLKLLSGGRMRDVQQTLQQHLRHTLSENLGIENLGQIDIIATGFKSGKITTSPVVSAESQAEKFEPSENDFDETPSPDEASEDEKKLF